VRTQAEVELVGLSQCVPVVSCAERKVQLSNYKVVFNFAQVDENFATLYGIRLRQGRWIDAHDVEASTPVAVLDLTAAIKIFGSADVLGKQLHYFGVDEVQRFAVTIVGVTDVVRTDNDQGADAPSMFVPVRWAAPGSLFLNVRTRGNPENYIAELQKLVAKTDQSVALVSVKTYAQAFRERAFGFRVIAGMFAPMGILALLLACTGLAGILGNLVARRMRESAIRRSLGATGLAVLVPLLRPLLWACGIGLAVGAAVAIPLSFDFNQMLFGGGALTLPSTLLTLAAVLLALFLAALLPARRALRADPNLILKQD
jgi:putative ABC transport system permease protein